MDLLDYSQKCGVGMYSQEQIRGSMVAWSWKGMGQVGKHHMARRQVAFDKLFLSLLIVLITISPSTLALLVLPPQSVPHLPSLAGRAVDNSSLLECLQVGPPVLSSAGGCQQVLMVHTFAFSYGEPFVG